VQLTLVYSAVEIHVFKAHAVGISLVTAD